MFLKKKNYFFKRYLLHSDVSIIYACLQVFVNVQNHCGSIARIAYDNIQHATNRAKFDILWSEFNNELLNFILSYRQVQGKSWRKGTGSTHTFQCLSENKTINGVLVLLLPCSTGTYSICRTDTLETRRRIRTYSHYTMAHNCIDYFNRCK